MKFPSLDEQRSPGNAWLYALFCMSSICTSLDPVYTETLAAALCESMWIKFCEAHCGIASTGPMF